MFPEQRPPDEPRELVSAPVSTKTRIDYLDGIRGIAALAVVILHAFQMFGYGLAPVGIVSDGLLTGHPLEQLLPPLYNYVIQFGAFAVEVFIVISGYSLMLGVARSADGQVKGGILAYFKRRVRRIWPPYYAALLLSVLIIVVVPGMNTQSGMYWDLALPVTTGGVVSHALFFHYLTPAWFYKLNPPMWTVALEEHIYILFPFVLLPLWRRLGTVWLPVLGVAGSIAFWYLLSPWFSGANFWYVGLFSLGAAGASISFSKGEREQRWRARAPWGKLSLAFFALFAFVVQYTLRYDTPLNELVWLEDVILGVAVAAMLVHFTEVWKVGESSRFSPLRLFRLPVVVGLGLFSYSLYLMHAPVLAIVALVIRDLGMTSIPAYALILFVGVPIALVTTYLFHLVFEKPFMPVHATQGRLSWLTSLWLLAAARSGHSVHNATVDQRNAVP